MMPKPSQRVENNSQDRGMENPRDANVIFKTKPNLLTYPDNFITKIIVVFILAFLFVPLIALAAHIQLVLMTTFNLEIPQLTTLAEIVDGVAMFIVILKLGLDVLDRNNTEYTLTKSHIIINRGLFRREKLSMPYAKIQDIEISQNILERFLNVGDVIVYGGHDNSQIILDDTPNPREVEELISQQQQLHDSYHSGYPSVNRRYNPRYENNNRYYDDQPNYNDNYYNNNNNYRNQPPVDNSQYSDVEYFGNYEQPQYNERQPQYNQYQQQDYNQQQDYYRQPQQQQNYYEKPSYQKSRSKPKRQKQQQYYDNEPNYNYQNNNYQDDENSLKKRFNDRKLKNKQSKQEKEVILEKHSQMFKKYNKK